MTPVLLVPLSYLLGAIPTSYWVGRWFHGIDLRQHGSGNLGATNVYRVLGWKAALFSLMASSILGAAVGTLLILLRRREWSSRLPYGPYIAVAATVWIFGGYRLATWWLTL